MAADDNQSPDKAKSLALARFQSRGQSEQQPHEGKANEPRADTRPMIELGPKDSPLLGEVVAAAMQHLAAGPAKIFQRGGILMRPVVEPAFDAKGKPVKVASLVEIEEGVLKLVLMRDLRWTRKSKKDGVRYVNPGIEVPRLILKARGEWPLPAVSGLINAPTLRPDGSLLQEEGYDCATGLLLINAPLVPIKPKPTQADAKAALETLKGLLSEAPFESDAGRAVALSLILSAILRGALERSPLHLYVSPTAGSGKSFIVDIACLIATGERCAVVAATSRAEELEKRIAAAMMTGRPLISLDNLNGVLASDLLCQAVTQPIVTIRAMGGDTERRVIVRSVFAATGNNLVIADDLDRRTLLASLDAHVERPWEREFKQEPFEMIARDRARYINAALTIPLAYLQAGMPNLPRDLNGFEQWSRFVRAPLMWVGEVDPASTMSTARENDPRLQASAAMLAAMRDLLGFGKDQALTAAQIIDATDLTKGAEAGPKQKALREALMEVAAAGKEVSPTKLGYWLRGARSRIIGGLRLCSEQDKHAKVMRWWVEQAET